MCFKWKYFFLFTRLEFWETSLKIHFFCGGGGGQFDWLLIWDVILKSWGSLENLLELPRLAPVSYLSDCSKTLFGESSFTVLQWGSKQGGSEFLGKLWNTPSICRFILWFLNGSFRTKHFFAGCMCVILGLSVLEYTWSLKCLRALFWTWRFGFSVIHRHVQPLLANSSLLASRHSQCGPKRPLWDPGLLLSN